MESTHLGKRVAPQRARAGSVLGFALEQLRDELLQVGAEVAFDGRVLTLRKTHYLMMRFCYINTPA